MRIELDANSLGCGCKASKLGFLDSSRIPRMPRVNPVKFFWRFTRAAKGSCLGWSFPRPDHNRYSRPDRDQTVDVIANSIISAKATQIGSPFVVHPPER